MFLLALAGGDGARALLGNSHVELVAEAAERGFLAGENQTVHPLLRGSLLAKLRELEDAKIQATVASAVEYLVEQHRWDDCLYALEQFPDDELILETFGLGLAEILDSGRIVSVSNWVELAARRELAAPVLLLAQAEVAIRQRDDQRAQTLGEQAGLSLSGDLAARAYLTAGRAAHLRNLASSANALCDRALAETEDSTLGMEALWVKFSVARELASSDTLDIVAQLDAFEGHDTPRRFG